MTTPIAFRPPQLIECPKCGAGRIRRQAGRCSSCKARLIVFGEFFDANEESAWMWDGKGWIRLGDALNIMTWLAATSHNTDARGGEQ